ncbi:hypothetical protein CVIRNUC_001436 [Coccomyxa viridis]|uniref:glutamine--tRNA ligase n=1 Tax=Coccomyxa viridis TaxID=1274662 RepID=A0AAV1HUU4_9CHLO|nr:hypothetical protein CVIRNUC_001436 [Coccomyxa viridis]
MATREDAEAKAERTFLSVGYAPVKAEEYASNRKLRPVLLSCIEESGLSESAEKTRSELVVRVATKYPDNALRHRRDFLKDYLASGKIKKDQFDASLAYLENIGDQPIDWKAFEAEHGVGVEVSPEQISAAVAEELGTVRDRLVAERYHYNAKPLLPKIKAQLKFADGAAIKQELDKQIEAILGPKQEADNVKLDKKAKKKEKKPIAVVSNGEASLGGDQPAASAAPAPVANGDSSAPEANPYAFLPDPQDNHKVLTTVSFSDERGQWHLSNSREKLAEHLKATGGKVITRFPPEPNGYLHIGHAKAMFVDFGYAENVGGECILRFDDTNPEAEKQEYIDHIEDIVGWMGYKPSKVTHSAHYFQQLYEYAVKLIETGNAFVDHQTAEEVKLYREERRPSPWRNRPVQESLKLFEDMRAGLIDEGKACLRMKMDHKNENYNMFDLVAYRIKFMPHPITGEAWCIYPTYDYTHCLVDAIENITHSLCTLEFESRRASYYWLLHVLGTYKPLVWEYARLGITYNVLSKRKLKKLVTEGHVSGWDDPRLLTLAGLRRRGARPQAIKNMCREIGITRNETEIPLHKLDYHIRADLDTAAERVLAVLKPLKLVLTNLPEDYSHTVEAKLFPSNPDSGTYPVPLSRVVYIEETDFKEADPDKALKAPGRPGEKKEKFFGMAPGKECVLKYAGLVMCTGLRKEGDKLVEVHGEFQPLKAGQKLPKGVLSWVGQATPGREPPRFEARLYDRLFNTASVADTGEDWLEDLNPKSLITVEGAMATPRLAAAAVGDKFQLERLGFFCVDPDSMPGKLVINRTCTLKADYNKEGDQSKER